MKSLKTALIIGITGQDGSYLADFLLKKKYKIIGLVRRSSSFNTERIDHLYEKNILNKRYFPYYGDLTDTSNLIRIIQETKPDEIYNLGAQSHVKTSFEVPEYTANVDGLSVLKLLEAVRRLKFEKKIKFYQASTSEIFGNTKIPQSETTEFRPASPYAISKLFAYWIVVNYRNAYNIFAVNGILFNHESEKRGATFVTRKITRAVAQYYCGIKNILYLGNLNAKRDWGSAKDYVKTMWKMLQQKKPDDYVVATGITRTVKDFVNEAFKCIGVKIKWSGKGLKEIGTNSKTKEILVKIDKYYFRPTEVNELRGDASKARKNLKWRPETSFKRLVKEMVTKDIQKIEKK